MILSSLLPPQPIIAKRTLLLLHRTVARLFIPNLINVTTDVMMLLLTKQSSHMTIWSIWWKSITPTTPRPQLYGIFSACWKAVTDLILCVLLIYTIRWSRNMRAIVVRHSTVVSVQQLRCVRIRGGQVPLPCLSHTLLQVSHYETYTNQMIFLLEMMGIPASASESSGWGKINLRIFLALLWQPCNKETVSG